MGLLTDKTAIVTGAGGGIGRAHAILLASEGAAVVVNDIVAETAGGVRDEIIAAGGQAIADSSDIATDEGASTLVQQAQQHFGRLDLLLNNAGNLRDRSFLKMSEEEFDAVWRVHVKGTFFCAQQAAQLMKDQGRGGVIINTSSGSHFGNFGQSNYAAAKGAIASMTYTWAIELARYGIRVNAICPVAMSRMTDGILGDAADDSAARWAPEHNAPLVVYLASDEARNISGQVFGVGGDRLAHMVQPHYGKTLTMEGGWTVDAIREQFQQEMPAEFGAFGIYGKPYPFHNGVLPPGDKT
jgi:3-oxoacyl-[acyl-carrier protein] reductase